jgi:plasmid stabilization system protein ParE
LRLIVRPDAEADIAAAYDWYEEQRHGLGKEFLEEVSAVIETVRTEPLRFPAIYRTLRRALVHRFPYGIFFVFRVDTITVVAAMHLARHPRRIHRRAKPDL